jgi:N-acetylmuramoyl-L-alanine amidase
MLTGLLIALAGCSGPRVYDHGSLDWNSSAPTNRPPARIEPETAPAVTPLPPPPAVVSPPPRSHTNSYADTWIPLGRWGREHQVGTLRKISAVPLPTFALTTSNGVLVLQANSRVARWNDLELHLGFEPQLIDDQPFVHVLDLKKNVEPLLREFAVVDKTNRVVVIDPGHGGSNQGTTSVLDGAHEKEFTLDWAERLGSLLSSNGWEVFLTRTDDIELPLSSRVAFAEEHQADLFISLHFNSAAPDREQAGLETYCLTPTGMPSTLTREYEDNAALVFTNNAFDAENLQYALRLHRGLLQIEGLADRGVRRARFLGVLRGQNRPAVLLEGGYLSNPKEAKRIADPAYRQLLAEAVAAALQSEAGIQEPEIAAPQPELKSQTSEVKTPAVDFRAPAADVRSSNSPATNAPLH